MVGTALLLFTFALIIHPAEAAGTGAVPLAGFEWRVISPEPVAASILSSDTAQGCEENFFTQCHRYRVRTPTNRFSPHPDERTYMNPCGTQAQIEKGQKYFHNKKGFLELLVLSYHLHPGGCTDDPECCTGNHD